MYPFQNKTKTQLHSKSYTTVFQCFRFRSKDTSIVYFEIDSLHNDYGLVSHSHVVLCPLCYVIQSSSNLCHYGLTSSFECML